MQIRLAFLFVLIAVLMSMASAAKSKWLGWRRPLGFGRPFGFGRPLGFGRPFLGYPGYGYGYPGYGYGIGRPVLGYYW